MSAGISGEHTPEPAGAAIATISAEHFVTALAAEYDLDLALRSLPKHKGRESRGVCGRIVKGLCHLWCIAPKIALGHFHYVMCGAHETRDPFCVCPFVNRARAWEASRQGYNRF